MEFGIPKAAFKRVRGTVEGRKGRYICADVFNLCGPYVVILFPGEGPSYNIGL